RGALVHRLGCEQARPGAHGSRRLGHLIAVPVFLDPLLSVPLGSWPWLALYLGRTLVVPKAEENRLAEEPLVGPLRVLHLAHDPRLDPGRAAVFRQRPFAGRRRPTNSLEIRMDPGQLLPGESTSRPPAVGQLPVDVLCQMQRTESLTRSFRGSEANHDEVVRFPGPDLDPCRRAAASIWRVRLLADDPLESEPTHLLVQSDAVALEVIEIAEDAG